MRFVGGTPGGVADSAINGHADYFVEKPFSIGPLAQYAGIVSDFLDSVLSGPASKTAALPTRTARSRSRQMQDRPWFSRVVMSCLGLRCRRNAFPMPFH